MERYFIVVSGLVQQVGFRYFVYQTAVKFNLTGWVRNCFDGTVELEVQGDETVISKFIDALRKGNRFSRVDNIAPNLIDIKQNEKSFKIIG